MLNKSSTLSSSPLPNMRVGTFLFSFSQIGQKLIVLLLLAVILWPLFLLVQSALNQEVWSWIWQERSDLIKVLSRSFGLAFLTSFFTILISVPLAFFTEKTNLPYRSVFRILFVLPLAIPPYVGAFSYINMLGPKGLLYHFLGLEFPIFTLLGAALVMAVFIFPYVYLSLAATLKKMNFSLEEVSASLGQTKFQTFKRVTLPLCLPGILAGSSLVGLYVLGDFGAVSFLRMDTFTARIFDEFEFVNMPGYSGLSLVLVIVALFFLSVERGLLRSERYVQDTGRSKFKLVSMSKGMSMFALAFSLLILFVSLLAPVFYLIWEASSFQHKWALLVSDLGSIWVSLKLAFCAATVTTVVAIFMAPFMTEKGFFQKSVNVFPLLLYVVPGTVLGIMILAGVLKFDALNGLRYTIWLLVFAFLCKYLNQALRITAAAHGQINPHVLEASRSLGASSLRTKVKILLPLLAPALIFSWMLVFVSSMKELAATLILKFSPAGIEPLSVRIWMYYSEFASPDKAALLSLFLLFFTLVPFALMYWLVKPRIARERE